MPEKPGRTAAAGISKIQSSADLFSSICSRWTQQMV